MKSNIQEFKPMSWGLSIIYFAIPALLMVVGFYIVMPYLIHRGMATYYAYSIGLGLPLFALLLVALAVYRLEGNPLEWKSLLERFRYHPMTGRDWLWTGGIFSVQLLVFSQVSGITRRLIENGTIPLPKTLPAFVDPRTIFSTETLDTAVGGLQGNWMVLIVSVAVLIINVVGEEFWWRGVIFPRQEMAFHKWVWVIHGVMWALFHSYKYWDVFSLLPMTLGLSFTVYYLKKNTPGLVVHFIGNGVGLLPIFLGILGL